jgi:FkbM family methyltransferase
VNKYLSTIVKYLPFKPVRNSTYAYLQTLSAFHPANRWIKSNVPTELKNFILNNLESSHSQLQQDLLVLYLIQGIKTGILDEIKLEQNCTQRHFFVEFGATNGMTLSNTYILEKYFNWQGILSEPAKCWHEELNNNRQSTIDNRCVWSRTGELLTFSESATAEHSSISGFSRLETGVEIPIAEYKVETISLSDLLDFHNAPSKIDFISIDTEGSEYEILRTFDFFKFEVVFFAIEASHNESQIADLMLQNGYSQIYRSASGWDRWFLKNSYLHLLS